MKFDKVVLFLWTWFLAALLIFIYLCNKKI